MPIEWEVLPVIDEHGVHTHDDYGYRNLIIGFGAVVCKDLLIPARGWLLFVQEAPDIRTGGRGRTFITPGITGSMHWPTAEAARNAAAEYISQRIIGLIKTPIPPFRKQ
jgi:hypothetical protein